MSVSAPRLPLLNTTLRWFLFAMILASISGAMMLTMLAVLLSPFSQLGDLCGICGS